MAKFKEYCSIVANWIKYRALALCVFTVGLAGAIACAYLVPDNEWKITSISYFSAIAACAVVCFVCRRGSLCHKNIEEDLWNLFKINTKISKDSDYELLFKSAKSKSSESGGITSSQGAVSERISAVSERIPVPPPDSFKDPADVVQTESSDNPGQVIQAEIHVTNEDPEKRSAKSDSSGGNGSSSSNAAVGSDPPTSMSPPDSGITLPSTNPSPPSSGEAKQIPPPTDP